MQHLLAVNCYYKYFFLMPEKSVKWMWEVWDNSEEWEKAEEKDKPEKTFSLLAYSPETELNRTYTDTEDTEYDEMPGKQVQRYYPTSGELAAESDWTDAKRQLKQESSIMDKIATGSIIAMPLICLFAIMMLLDMISQNNVVVAGG